MHVFLVLHRKTNTSCSETSHCSKTLKVGHLQTVSAEIRASVADYLLEKAAKRSNLIVLSFQSGNHTCPFVFNVHRSPVISGNRIGLPWTSVHLWHNHLTCEEEEEVKEINSPGFRPGSRFWPGTPGILLRSRSCRGVSPRLARPMSTSASGSRTGFLHADIESLICTQFLVYLRSVNKLQWNKW